MNSLIPIAYKRVGEQRLLSFSLPGEATTQADPVGLHHCLVVDVSGSMSRDLRDIRANIKSWITGTKPNDEISIVWFSGRQQAGTLIERETVKNLAQLENLKSVIDRWLQPIGLTGFAEPFEIAAKLAMTSSVPTSLVFMTDGCDNQSDRSKLVTRLREIAHKAVFSAVAIIEYGYYADRELLAKMAEILGGSHIFAEGYQEYAISVQTVLRNPSASPRSAYEIPANPVGGFVFTIDKERNEISKHEVANGSVVLPEGVERVYCLGEVSPPHVAEDSALDDSILYAALRLHMYDSSVTWGILEALKDKRFIEDYSKAFGKQKQTEFAELAEGAVFSPRSRMVGGVADSIKIRRDLVTIPDLLSLLYRTPCKVKLDFKYNRIGRKTVELDPDEVLEKAAEAYTSEATPTAKAALLKAAALNSSSATFTPDPIEFYSIDGLVMPSDRANLSFRVVQPGTVNIENPPADLAGILPQTLRTKRFRNYAVISDGLLNISTLTFEMTINAILEINNWLSDGRVSSEAAYIERDGSYTFRLYEIPISNLYYAKPPSPEELFKMEWQSLVSAAALKAATHFLKSDERSSAYALTFGPEAKDWLKSIGVTDSGWNPPRKTEPATDVTLVKSLYIRLKGFAALPSMNEFFKQRDKGKLSSAAQLMEPTVERIEKLIAEKGEAAAFGDIQAIYNTAKEVYRQNSEEYAKVKFAIIVTNSNLRGADPDQTEFEVEVEPGKTLTGIFNKREVEIPI